MDQWEPFIKRTVELIGFRDYRVEIKPDEKKGAVYIYEDQNLLRDNLPSIVEALNHIVQMVAKKSQAEAIFVDVNNYRQERENLIAELARAAAKKVLATKQPVSLPAMNSYERRLVHVALAIHPDVRTESAGEGKERYVIIKLVGEEPAPQKGAEASAEN